MNRKTKLIAFVTLLLVAALGGGWAISNRAPAVRLPQLDGGEFDLAQCEAEVVVLDFWLASCGMCRQTLPMVEDVAEWARSEGKPVAFYAVNAGDPADVARRTHDDLGLTMPVLLDQKLKVTRGLDITTFPSVVILMDGRVAHLRSGFNPDITPELKDELTALLQTTS